MELRDYQRAAVDAIFAYFGENTGNPLVVVPTGGGKSLIIAQFIREAIEQYPRTRVLILQHVQELISQNHSEMRAIWPEAPAGIYSSGIGLRQIDAQVLFGGVQSLRGKAAALGHVDLVIVDEAHMIPRSSDTTYQALLRELTTINPHLKVIGLTATPFRLDSGSLHRGEGAMFDGIAYDIPIRLLFDGGYLTPLVTPGDLGMAGNLPQIDTSSVGTSRGEFRAAELDAASVDPEAVRAVCNSIVEHGANRAGWLVFGAGTQHCAAIHAGLRERGHMGDVIFGNTPKRERGAIIERFKARDLRYLVSLGVLTTGFNAKHVDLLACARPTKSTPLYIQMLGRGTRCIGADAAESARNGKANCLVLDFGGNIDRHGPIDKPRIRQMPAGARETAGVDAPLRPCPRYPLCEEYNPVGMRRCARCGAEYPDATTLIATTASNASIMSAPGSDDAAGKAAWLPVDSVRYSSHTSRKPGAKPSLCVTYYSGMQQIREWVCLEHDGFARDKAARWWARRSGTRAIPEDVGSALRRASLLRKPSSIAVKQNDNGYYSVVGVQFMGSGRYHDSHSETLEP